MSQPWYSRLCSRKRSSTNDITIAKNVAPAKTNLISVAVVLQLRIPIGVEGVSKGVGVVVVGVGAKVVGVGTVVVGVGTMGMDLENQDGL